MSYSQDEMASQDIPTIVRYALQHTAAEKLFYVGYSQGTRLLYMAASAEDTIVDKVCGNFENLHDATIRINGAWYFQPSS